MEQLLSTAARVGELLKARGETVAVAESSTGGLISAALLAVPGASAFYMGGGVLYTARARHRLLGLGREDVEGMRSASPPYAMLLARTVRARLDVDWGIAETGASGPSGNPYGDAAGHTCLAVSGSSELERTLETGSSDRYQNMLVFAESALALLEQALAA
jgi:nicotinamide-nucleotide amidase